MTRTLRVDACRAGGAWVQTEIRVRIIRRLSTLVFCVAMCVLCVDAALAASGDTIGTIAQHVTDSIEGLAKLVIAGAFVAGMGFAVGAVLKFKQHKDNPTQIPAGTPIALMFIAAALMYLPSIFGTLGKTIFGDSYEMGNIRGTIDITK